MNLAKRLAEVSAAPMPGPRCTMCRILTELPPADADTLNAALAGREFTAMQIAEALTAEGFKVQGATVARHRRGECLGAG